MTTTVTEFQNVMGWAKRLAADSNRAGLEDLIKIVLRPVQADRMRVALTRSSHRAPDGLWWTRSMGGSGMAKDLMAPGCLMSASMGVEMYRIPIRSRLGGMLSCRLSGVSQVFAIAWGLLARDVLVDPSSRTGTTKPL